MVWISSSLSFGSLIHRAAQKSIATPTDSPLTSLANWTSDERLVPANNSLERTQPQRDFMYDVGELQPMD